MLSNHSCNLSIDNDVEIIVHIVDMLEYKVLRIVSRTPALEVIRCQTLFRSIRDGNLVIRSAGKISVHVQGDLRVIPILLLMKFRDWSNIK